MIQNGYVLRKNGDWRVLMYPDGTKILLSAEPNPTADYPESVEVNITLACDMECKICYASARSNDPFAHAKTDEFLPLLLDLPQHTEIALGGGDPVSHPDFSMIVSVLSDKGFFVTTSINQYHPRDHATLCASLPLSGIGVSVVGNSINEETFRILSEGGKQITAHVIVGCTDWSTVLDIFKITPRVLLLGYKAKGRGAHCIPQAEIARWRENFKDYLKSLPRNTQLGFDNLAIHQLKISEIVPPSVFESLYLGEEGRLTMFYDAVSDRYGPSSMHKTEPREKKSLVECFHSFCHNPSEWESEEWKISKEL